MSPLQIGDDAPVVPGVRFGGNPVGLFFYKVTCPTCRMAAPAMSGFERAFPGSVIGIGQDPAAALETFTDEFDLGIMSIEDEPPYRLSDAFAVETVPTLFLIGDDGRVLDAVGAWDREGFNRVAATLADRLGVERVVVSAPDDGRPDFKPG